MNKNNLLIFSILILIFYGCAPSEKLVFRSTESDAQIWVNGQKAGIGSTDEYVLKENHCIHVKVEKIGFITYENKFCKYDKKYKSDPNIKLIELIRDDAYDASIQSDQANKDFIAEVNKKYTIDEAWKIIHQTLTNYFEIEYADKETGYLKTTWQSMSFRTKTVRTRAIVKQYNLTPLQYQVRIVSEIALKADQSVKNDEKFMSWDRILRKYDGVINEFQTRLSAK
ncbi:MAG: hypothetical protein KA792_04300 [Bacteroidales bacterium]|nr:hypothetical protein [Bacteroidales bacterium]